MYLSKIAEIINAEESIIINDENIDEIVIDTRWIHHSDTSIFVALSGHNRNGHAFVSEAYKKGIKNFIVHKDAEVDIFEDANYLFANDTLRAIQLLAIYKSSIFSKKKIGITGSNGKTIVKEWLSTILSESDVYNREAGVCKSPKSYNSQIGVALSLWHLEENNTIGIFEGGISDPGEMSCIEEMIQPQIGILTNIGEAHLENFENRQQLADEKILLFRRAKQLIYRCDDPVVNNAVAKLQTINSDIEVLNWSTENHKARYFVTYHIEKDKSSRISIIDGVQSFLFSFPFTQKAFIENGIHTVIALILLGLDIGFIQESISMVNPLGMRLELRDAINNSVLIADTYNSDLSSIKVAIDFLSQQKSNEKIIIISDISGSMETHNSLVKIINKSAVKDTVKKVVTIGPIFFKLNEIKSFDPALFVESYYTTEDFFSQFQLNQYRNNAILLKGARKYEFERIQQRLELQIHNTVMEINLESLQHNLNEYRKTLPKGLKLMGMVKAFSYGHGGVEIAEKLQYEGVDYLAVAYTDEGIELRQGGIQLPIMVMSPDVNAFESMIRWHLEPEIFSVSSLLTFIEKTKLTQEFHYPIHLKLNTGMNRLGIDEEDVDSIIDILKSNEKVRVASIFSHLAASDDVAFDEFTLAQKKKFDAMVQKLLETIDYRPLIHLANTAGISFKSDLKYSMVRLGIGLYGINTGQKKNLKLKPVATLKSYIVQIRNVKAGETVGYSCRGKIEKDSVIATVAIGYADGYFRDFGNGNGYMLVKGKKAPVVGSVCMDMTMIDVTDIHDAIEGDEVIIFGGKLPVQILAEKANTIPYEIFTSVSQRVKRLFINA